MKTIKLSQIKIQEITIIPDKGFSVLYKVLDDANNVIINNRISINREDLPTAGQNAMDTLVAKLLDKIISKEL